MLNRREIMWAGVILAPLVVGLFANRWIAGSSIYFSIVEEGFPVAANYPWDRFVARCLAAGRFPLWNPYQSCGNTFIANYLPAFFFAPRWIMYLSDGVFVRDLYVLLRFWLGGVFLYIFLRRISLKIPGSALATVAFLTGGYFTRYYNENYLNIDLFLGLWLLAGEELVRRKSLGATIGAGLAILAIVLGGHPEAAFHALLIMTLWVVYRAWAVGRREGGALKPVVLFLTSGTAAGLAASAQIAPFLEALSQSTNYHVPNLGRYHYQLKHLATLAYPWIYGLFPEQIAAKSMPLIDAGTSYAATTMNWVPTYLGIIPMMFAGAAFLKIRKSNPAAAFFGIYMLVMLGGVFGIPPFNSVFAVPPLSRLGNYKHLFPEITICVAALAGMGFDTLLKLERMKSVRVLIPSISGLYLLGEYVHLQATPINGIRVYFPGLLPMIVIGLFFMMKERKFRTLIISIAAPGITYGMTFYYQTGYLPKNQRYLLQMENAPFVGYLKNNLGDDRYTSLYPPLLQTFGTLFETSDIRGHDALNSEAFWNLLMDVNGGDIQDVTAYYLKAGGFQPFTDALGDRRLENLRLKYIVSPADLGGMIAIQAIIRRGNAKTVSSDHYSWDVWDKEKALWPVLFTHPPIKLELDYTLPESANKLEMALGWMPDVADKDRDGAFVLVREERDGAVKTLYARYMPPDEKSWVKAPIPVFPDPGVRRTIIVHPMAKANLDWLGWKIANAREDFWGYQLAFPGAAVGIPGTPYLIRGELSKVSPEFRSVEDFWKTIMVYEKPGLPPLFSLAEGPGAPAKYAFPARRVGPDEYILDNTPTLPVLVSKGFNYRPGWRLFGKKEIKINVTKPFYFFAKLRSNDTKDSGPFKLIYIPWGFKVGLWASVSSILSLIFLMVMKKLGTCTRYVSPVFPHE